MGERHSLRRIEPRLRTRGTPRFEGVRQLGHFAVIFQQDRKLTCGLPTNAPPIDRLVLKCADPQKRRCYAVVRKEIHVQPGLELNRGSGKRPKDELDVGQEHHRVGLPVVST
jgi:hypothetical protein